MGYTQFLKRYWAWENGITLYKDPENHSGPWERYEEISDGSFEENIIKQCGTRGEKLIKCISDLSDRLKVIIDTVVGDVEISAGRYSKAREFLKKNKNRPLKMNCTPFVRQYGILFKKWGVFVCRKRKSKRHIVENSK